MIDVKVQFKEWLIKNGLSEKTKTGRLGTVYEYLKRIDRLCVQLYGKEEWESLLKDIHTYYILHKTLALKKYENAKPEKIYDSILTLGKLYEINRGYDQSKYISKYLRWLESNPKRIRSIKTALEKLFIFYTQNEDLFNEINGIQKNPEGRKNTFFDEYFENVLRVKEAIDRAASSTVKISQEANGTNPRLIEPEKNFSDYPKKIFHSRDVASSLGCSSRTITRIVSQNTNVFGSTSTTGKYTVASVQRYLKKHHYPSKNRASVIENAREEDWITGKEAAAIIGCSLTTFIRKYRDNGFVSYTNYTPRKVKYFKPDVEKIKNNP